MNEPLPPVLIVDDERNMRRSLETMLTDEGYSVRAAESAEEALGLLAQIPFFHGHHRRPAGRHERL